MTETKEMPNYSQFPFVNENVCKRLKTYKMN